jgi:transposase InsO family protein
MARVGRPERSHVWNVVWALLTIGVLATATRAYLQVVIDNFSRRILAWRVAADRLLPDDGSSLPSS